MTRRKPTPTATAEPPAPLLTGWCNPSNPPSSHARCGGVTPGAWVADHRERPCPCPCHTTQEEPIATETPAPVATHAPAPRVPIAQASTDLAAAVDTYARSLVDDAVGPMPWEDVAVILHDLKAAAAILGALASNLSSTLYLKAPHGDVEHPTLGIIGIRRGKDRTAWDHDAAATAYLDARIDAYAADHSGELPGPHEVLAMLREGASISGWKVTAFRRVDLDPDEYATVKPGRVGIDYRST